MHAFLKDAWFLVGSGITALSTLTIGMAWLLSSPEEASEALKTALWIAVVTSQIGIALMFLAIFRIVYRALSPAKTPRSQDQP